MSASQHRPTGALVRTMFVGVAVVFAALVMGTGCNLIFPPVNNEPNNAEPNTTEPNTTEPNSAEPNSAEPNTPSEPVFNNLTDRTNNGATYIGSKACMACHADVAAEQIVHGHAHKLNKVQGQAPSYPEEGTRAGGFDPPEGKTWDDVAYVIGGYIRKARFVDLNGYVMTTGVEGVNTQWNLDFPPNGNTPGWVPYEADRAPDDPKPYNESCFVCHTTGPMPSDPDHPTFQDNRPGMEGTFAETGVQCESCHGPGSNHVPNPAARNIYVDKEGVTCNECHNRPFQSDTGEILASGGYIKHHEQYPELQASGGHATFNCMVCHDPHVSTNYDRENAITTDCTDCHTDKTLDFHEGKIFVRGDYTERLSCESCHMPYATKSGSAAGPDIAGEFGRIGDMRTHIFRINVNPVDYTAMFSDDGKSVVRDSQGRAAVTVDYVCLRCHNGVGNAFGLTISAAAAIAEGVHGN